MSNDNSASIVSKVPPSPRLRRTGWNYAPVLKSAGVGYGESIEQITYLRQTMGGNFTPRFGRFLWCFREICIFSPEKTLLFKKMCQIFLVAAIFSYGKIA